MPPIKTGVEAFWDNKDFQRGFGEFMKGVAAANKAAGGSAVPIGAMGGAAEGSTLGLAGMGAMAVAGGIALYKLAAAAVQTAKDIWKFSESAVMTAGRVEELTIVMQLLGQRQGYTAAELTNMTDEIRAQGIQTDVALGLMAQFARYSLDMADASKLAAVAQNAAVLSDENSSQALDGLLRGILTYNQRVLRTHGINLDVSRSFDIYAKSVGKSADQLTEQEKVQATLNGVIASGANIVGVYAAAQESAYKQSKSLTRYIYDLKAALGAPFLKAFGEIVSSLTQFYKALTVAVSEGGRLYPLMVALGTIMSFVSGGIKAVANALTSWLAPIKTADDAWSTMARQAGGNAEVFAKVLKDSTDTIATPFINAAADAIQWGAEIMINLASGLMQGAAAAVTAALNWISNLLTSWLAPGSPPKIIPEIDTYGAATMTEYLNGFTKADFSALDAIQGQLRQVFSTLVDQGRMTQKELGPLFADISKDIIEAMATGTVNEDLFKKIRQSGGAYGKELEQLARDQIALAQAENQVKTAEEALEEARKREMDTGKQVNAERMKYNRMLRAGASAADLKAQLAKVNAAEAAHETAVQDVATAEQNLDTAKENIDTLKEQAALQQEILDQLLEIAQAQVPPKETGGAGGAGGPPEPPPPPEGGGIDTSAIENKLKELIGKIRQEIIDKLKDVWNDLVDLWLKKMGPAFDKLKVAWERFKTAVSPIVDFLKAKWEAFKNWLSTAIPNLLTGLKNWWAQHGQNVITIVTFVWNELVRLATQLWNNLVSLWNRYGGDIEQIASDIWTLISGIVTNGIEGISLIIDGVAAAIRGDWGTFWEDMRKVAALAWDNIKNLLTVVWDIIKLAFKVVLDFLKLYWSTVWEGIKLAAETVWNGIKTTATNIFTDIKEFLSKTWDAISQKVNDVWNGIKSFLEGLIRKLFDWMGLNFDEQKAYFEKLWADIELIFTTVWERIKSYLETKWGEISAKAFDLWAQITGWIKTAITDVQGWLSARWDEIKATAETVWNTISTTLSGIAQGIVDSIKGVLGMLTGPSGAVSGFVGDMVQAGKNLIQGLIDGVGQMAGALLKAVEKIVSDAIEAIKKSLGLASPSKVMMKIGFQTIKGLEQGIKLTANLPKNALNQAVNSMIPPSTPVPVMAGPSYRNMNMTNNIYPSNNLDAMALGRFIEQTVIKAMRR